MASQSSSSSFSKLSYRPKDTSKNPQPAPATLDFITFTLKYRGEEEVITLGVDTTTKDLSEGIWQRLQIRVENQTYHVPKYGWIKMRNVIEHIPLTVFNGKKIKLLGTPQPTIDRMNRDRINSSVSTSWQDTLYNTARVANEELRRKVIIADQIAGSNPAGPMDPDELFPGETVEEAQAARRCFGRKCPTNRAGATTIRAYYETMIGTGLIPQQQCSGRSQHSVNNPLQTRCPNCLKYVLEWLALLSWNIDQLGQIVTRLRNQGDTADYTATYNDLMARRSKIKSPQWPIACLDELHLMIEALDIDAFVESPGLDASGHEIPNPMWLENDNTDGCTRDIESFYAAFEMMSVMEEAMNGGA